MEFLGDFVESVFMKGRARVRSQSSERMDHPPARDLVVALLHFVSQRASLDSLGGESISGLGGAPAKALTTARFRPDAIS